MDGPGLLARARERVDALAGELVDTSRAIHAHPELGFEEHHAHDLLTAALERHGLDVTRGAYGLDTAFEATAGTEGPVVVVCCEYDALPGIGHACGHNVIAAAGLGAGLAAAALADEAGGRVRVLGTPAEEGGGGKILMADAGAFEGVDAALMVHPAGSDLRWMDTLAATSFAATFSGLAAHAAAFPERGRNALDAAVLGYVNVAALRQHIATSERVHGIFTRGGDKTNIVPELAEMDWMVRSGRVEDLDALVERVHACLAAGAAAAGCTWEHRVTMRTYADMVDNPVLLDRFAAHAEALGRPLADPRATGAAVTGSTDMGNVSHLVPSIHPVLKVSPPDVSIHSAAFTGHAGGPGGDAAAVDGARALAATVVDLWADPALLPDARAAFDAQRAAA
ncbi:MAG TPA: amidohydrolase [Acidimicrobiales bacterium]|nr:amidohydrolase [Acidimicrobiales bacterium]